MKNNIQSRLNDIRTELSNLSSSITEGTTPEVVTSYREVIIREKEIAKIKCPYCGAVYENTLHHCPHCGSQSKGIRDTIS